MKKILVIILIVILIIIFTRLFILSVWRVPGIVMYPLVHNGQKVLVLNKLWFEPQKGDVVIIRDSLTKISYIRRIIASSGDSISIDNYNVSVNGRLFYEPYKFMDTDQNRYVYPEKISLIVPYDEFFVMGDNRDTRSDFDSRVNGTVNRRQIIGKLIYIF